MVGEEMKMIEQPYNEIYVRTQHDDECEIEQGNDCIFIDKHGAKQLIEILQDWVKE